jgi:hypothetical protein
MEVIIHTDENNYRKLKEKLLADEAVNRASIVFKEAKQFGKEGGYLSIVSGTEDRCKRAIELAKGLGKDQKGSELAKEIVGKEKGEILKKIKEEEDKAIEGFGGIFG